MKPDKMVHMANQIALYYQSYPHDRAVAGVAEHLKKFWEPRMMAQMRAYVAAGAEGLNALIPEAVAKIP